jgi:hypothetical protein
MAFASGVFVCLRKEHAMRCAMKINAEAATRDRVREAARAADRQES